MCRFPLSVAPCCHRQADRQMETSWSWHKKCRTSERHQVLSSRYGQRRTSYDRTIDNRCRSLIATAVWDDLTSTGITYEPTIGQYSPRAERGGNKYRGPAATWRSQLSPLALPWHSPAGARPLYNSHRMPARRTRTPRILQQIGPKLVSRARWYFSPEKIIFRSALSCRWLAAVCNFLAVIHLRRIDRVNSISRSVYYRPR